MQLDKSVTFDRAAEYYDDTRGFPPGVEHEVAAFIARSTGLTGTERALEIGIGTGRIALPLAQYTATYFGVDLAAPMLAKLRSKDTEHRVKVTEGDVMRLPFAAGVFDVAVAVHILHLVPNPGQAVDELARVLKPGGRVIQSRDERDEAALNPLREAWNSVMRARGAVDERYKAAMSIFATHGWGESGEQMISFKRTVTAEEYADRYRKRIFSHSWLVPDDAWREGIAAVESVLKAQYPDPHAPIEVNHTIYVRMWHRPA